MSLRDMTRSTCERRLSRNEREYEGLQNLGRLVDRLRRPGELILSGEDIGRLMTVDSPEQFSSWPNT